MGTRTTWKFSPGSELSQSFLKERWIPFEHCVDNFKLTFRQFCKQLCSYLENCRCLQVRVVEKEMQETSDQKLRKTVVDHFDGWQFLTNSKCSPIVVRSRLVAGDKSQENCSSLAESYLKLQEKDLTMSLGESN